MSRAYASEHETTALLVAEVGRSWLRGLPTDSMPRYLRDVAQVGPASADRALRAWLVPDKVTWLVVGDLATLRPSLEQLGLPLVDRTP